ncbi:WD repeat-containing protein 89 isoform X2 [Parasteatoda tepidariorum]|uniref:WD repeat-containing protein 89 isoform X2 n=1 Tax=Parasteatoda tepidariorum TaxID=114398 RepID=UPI00077FDA44|nr:WD repeat-containing protein 89 [Parasteatoda tepidariorum]
MSLKNGSKPMEVGNDETLPKNCFSRLHACDDYILHSSVNELQQPKLAISVSSNEILLFDVESQTKIGCNKTHQSKITDLKFSKQEPNLLFSSSMDGTILVCDLRNEVKPIQSYSDDSDGSLKPLTCFDYNSEEQYICAGTEVIREDSFLIFWDKRMSKSIGGYWDSHFDEITQVQFHHSVESKLASASVDGLVNFFDLDEITEEDAMNNTLNVESSVNKFSWGVTNALSCITSTEEFQYWSTNEVKPAVSINKKQMSEDFMCDVDYLIDTFDVNNSIYLVSGTNEGSAQLYSCNKNGLKIMCELRDGHKDIIRTVCHSKKDSFLVTGGEDGILCIWKSPIK